MSSDLYQVPKAELNRYARPKAVRSALFQIGHFQRWVILSLTIYMTGVSLSAYVLPGFVLLALAGLLMSVFYGVQLAAALSYSRLSCVFVFLVMCIPLVNFIVMMRLNDAATQRLRAAGFTIGWLGAKLD
ncbi:MAG: hypothetical protein MI750_12925 [Xanthomonadales bacterium]|jgi:hypothetical protein|nr:hypothetical protein [Xanthomonadales bacterium]